MHAHLRHGYALCSRAAGLQSASKQPMCAECFQAAHVQGVLKQEGVLAGGGQSVGAVAPLPVNL